MTGPADPAARRAAEEALALWDTFADRPHSDARHEALYACVRSLRALLSEPEAPAPTPLTRDDAMTLIGHAEYLRRVHGETDMPRFFDGLAHRILSSSEPSAPALPPWIREAGRWPDFPSLPCGCRLCDRHFEQHVEAAEYQHFLDTRDDASRGAKEGRE